MSLLFQGLWTDPVSGISYARNRWYDARTASWLSEDPKGDIDSPNLYAFVGWQPHAATDPMGLYAKDFHFGAVYFLARAAGFSVEETSKLAWASQYVDDFPDSSPVTPAVSVLKAFHFVGNAGGVVTPDNETSRLNLDRARQTGDLIKIGMALHSYADTWAHKGFIGEYNPSINSRSGPNSKRLLRPPVGHLQDMTRDDPYRRVDDAVEAARKTYEVLRSEAIARGRQPIATWEEIEPVVEAVFRVKGDADERFRVWMNAIRKELNAHESIFFKKHYAPEAWVRVFEQSFEEQQSFILTLEGESEQGHDQINIFGGQIEVVGEDPAGDEYWPPGLGRNFQ